MKENWIENLLDRELRPMAAPDELWDRIHRPQPAPILRWRLAFALVIAVATAWALHPRAVAIQSERASEIHDWVKSRTGLDVPLAPSSSVKLCGARVSGHSAEIQFRTGVHDATLLVAKADHAAATHEFSSNSWTLRGQTYSSADRTACLLCHEE